MSAVRLHVQAALMLRAPWQWQRNDGRPSALRICVWLVLGVPTLALILFVPDGMAKALLGLLAVSGLLGVWGMQFWALLRLDHPHPARFVAGHGRALRATALGLWLAMVAFVVFVAALAFFGPVGGYPGLLLAALVAGAVLLCMAWAMRWPWLWVAIWLPFPFIDQPAVLLALKPVAFLLQEHWQAQPLLWTLLLLLAMAVALVNVFGNGDAAHARAYAKRERFRTIASAGAVAQKPALAAYGRLGEVLGRPFQRLADAWLERVTHRANTRIGSVMARAAVVLHGTQHWVRQLSAAVLMQVVVVACLALVSQASPAYLAAAFKSGHVGMGIGLSSIAIGPLLSLHGSLWGSRREQILLMLLPGMPQGTALNQAMARQQIKHYLLVWTALLPAFAALAHWGQAPYVWGFAGAGLPMAALLWRDVSTLRAPSPVAVFLTYLLGLGIGMLSMLLLRWQPALLLPWAVGVLAVTAGLLAWRWRLLSAWPQALPAGRLS